MIKVLNFTKYSRNAGSSRLRSFQYLPYFAEAGYHVEVSPLFGERYLELLYAGRPIKGQAVKGYCRRFIKLLTIWRYDHIIIEKELFPYLPSWVERIMSVLGVQFIVDYDDAIFHNYDRSVNKWVKLFLSRKIDSVMQSSRHVVVGNSYLAARAKRAKAKKITIIPTVIDMLRYHTKVPGSAGKIIVGWIGTRSTFEKHYTNFLPVIKALKYNNQIEFHVVGVTLNESEDENLKFFDWSETREVELINNFDIGVMPLVDSDWERGKCAYKLIQYMGCGLPVICSPIGMNSEVVRHGWNGYHAANTDEWVQAIECLAGNEKLRYQMGNRGRKVVAEGYSLEYAVGKWISVLKS